MSESNILLSAIVVVGSCRERGQRLLDALCSQTAADSIEILILDLAAYRERKLETSRGVRTVYVIRAETEPWLRARANAVRRAKAPIVAFIEDHCIPAPDWAEIVIQAHRDCWAAVGYAFTNANPETYVACASFLIDYGVWEHPASRGQVPHLPGNNISYNRDLLLSFGNQLETLITSGFNIQELFKKQGLLMFLESRAVIAHENFTQLSALLQANHAQGRMFAGERASVESWGRLRRWIYGLAVPIAAPLIKLFRLVNSFRRRRSLWPEFVACLPVVLLVFIWSAVGESLGYWFGTGNAEQELNRLELEVDRTAGA